jgi:predicted flap endonuclease-1-like 5' DNA nuclease
MLQTIDTNTLVIGLAVLAVLLVGFILLRRGSTGAKRRDYKPDVLDEGAASIQRNQALIDAAPAAQIITASPVSATLAGVGEAVAIGAQDVVEEAAAEVEAAPEAPESAPAPAPEPEPEPAPSTADDLSRIKGLGPKLQALLPTLGITTYAQIAALTDADLAELDTKLGAFAGRPAKDNWVEQAKFLAAGDTAGFEAKFGKV